MRVVVEVQGGIVQAAYSDGPDVELWVVDHDTDMVEESELVTLPNGEEVVRTGMSAQQNRAAVALFLSGELVG